MPGKRDAYLVAIGETLTPILDARGLTLMGAYAVPMRTDEAVVLWAAPDFRHLCRVYAQRERDPDLQQWRKQVSAWRQSAETMWLVPSANCFFHPGLPRRRRRRLMHGPPKGRPYGRSVVPGRRRGAPWRARASFKPRAKKEAGSQGG